MTPAKASLLGTTFLLVLLATSTPAVAYDQNISYDFGTSPTANSQSLQLAIDQLANETSASNPQLASLANQLSNSLSSGNATAEQAALSKLEAYPQLKADAPALQALLQSLTVNGDGSVSVNPELLGSLLGANTPNSQGVPSDLQGVSPPIADANMITLLSLLNSMSSSNPGQVSELLNQLLNDQNQMSLGLPSGSLGKIPSLSGGLGSLPGVGSTPIIHPPTVPLGGLPPGQILEEAAIPIVLAFAGVLLFLFRKRIGGVFSGQTLPSVGVTLAIEEIEGSTPRARTLRAFNRMLRLMGARGIVKERHETHREFSAKCSPLPEAPHVNSLGLHYEKAKFSLYDVSEQDAAAAENEASAIETLRPVKN